MDLDILCFDFVRVLKLLRRRVGFFWFVSFLIFLKVIDCFRRVNFIF